MPKQLGQLSNGKVLLPLNCSTYTQNTANTASMKSIQLTDQLLGKPRFHHHTATPPALQIDMPASLVSIAKSKHRIIKTTKSPTCLCNLMVNLTNYSTTYLKYLNCSITSTTPPASSNGAKLSTVSPIPATCSFVLGTLRIRSF